MTTDEILLTDGGTSDDHTDKMLLLSGLSALIGVVFLVWKFLTATPREKQAIQTIYELNVLVFVDGASQYVELWGWAITNPIPGIGWILVHFVLLFFVGIFTHVFFFGGGGNPQIEDDPRVREWVKERFGGDSPLSPGDKVVCAGCGEVFGASSRKCPECGCSEVENS